ncbi:MAG: subclass B1 metallo-beta-lactamase [Phycisphaera sp.]|nr:MAG: subclass B1 metallo-beta-lactamase [Phycisphaera sp.]
MPVLNTLIAGILWLQAAQSVVASTVQPEAAVETAPEEGQVNFEQITHNVWIHTTHMSFTNWGLVPSNGLLVRGEQGTLVIDTGCSDEDMAQICNWAEANLAPVVAVVITHSHVDSMGGIDEAHTRDLPTISHVLTQGIAEKEGKTKPKIGFEESYNLHAYGIEGECFYAGAGHSVDNIVVWLEDEKVLFGGCFIRPPSSKSLGNTADADIGQWPDSVQSVLNRYSDIEHVVPGHFRHGGAELLSHTLDLLKTHEVGGDK